MTIAGLNQTDYLSVIKANGYEILSQKYWEEEGIERIVLGKGGSTFAIKLKKFYYYFDVVPKFASLGITIIPESCKEDYEHCVYVYNQNKKKD